MMKKFLFSILAILTFCLCFTACGDSKITVTFDGNGGVTENGETSVVWQIDPANFTTPTFYRDGYIFDGWSEDIKLLNKDATVKAKWKAITYSVTFDLDGGTLVSGNVAQTVEWNKSATAPTVEKTGYTFDGWNGLFDNVTQNLTVKAKWKINTYTITFDLDGGTIDDDTFSGALVDGTTDTYVLTVDYGSHVSYPKVKPQNEKVKLSSWEVVEGNLESVTANAQVKAIWTGTDDKSEHTVTFVLGKDNVTCTGDLEQTIALFGSATAPVVEDLPYYKFIGWDIAFDNIVVDTTVNARWQEIKHTITFNANGGTLVNGSLGQQTTEGKVILPTVKRTYYEFLGWYNGDTKVDENTLYTEDITLVARWQIKKVTIKFVDTVYKNTCKDKDMAFGEKLGELPVLVDKTGDYSFKVWYYLDGNKKVTVTSETILQIDKTELTLYANWHYNWTPFY